MVLMVNVWWDSTTRIRRGAVPGRAESQARRSITNTGFKTVRPYEYKDAATLLADFWSAVDAILREKGIAP